MTIRIQLPALAVVVLCVVALAACGGESSGDQAGTQTAAPKAERTPAPDGERDPRELPDGVPLRASRAADPAGARVVRAWAAAMRAGDVDAANALWHAPAKVQNGTAVLTLSNQAEIALFNGSLPCGSVVTAAGGAPDGFVIATVRLTRRKGADCGSGTGSSARTAIRVRDGRIVEWYRLPDDPGAPGLLPSDDVDSTTV